MGKITQNKRMRNYHEIFEQIYENPVMTIYDISVNTGLSRNTVAKYVKEMYKQGVIQGPHIRMRPAPNYTEYAYLMNFTDPWTTFHGLKGFPHVVYTAMTFGDWNTVVVSNRLLDFSKLVGFEGMVNQSVRYCSYTPKVEFISWDESFKRVYEQLDQFTPTRKKHRKRRVTNLYWGEDEWMLFYAFNSLRKRVTPVLREIKVTYETYTKWMKTLEDYCTIHTGFYPGGYKNYSCYCFLFFTDYEESVKSLFSLFPTTSFIMELDTQLLVFTYMISPKVKRNLFCLLYDMETKRMIKGFRQAVVLFHSQSKERIAEDLPECESSSKITSFHDLSGSHGLKIQ
ncbi:MAG: winged helix-turn-helix transcriptional regulator [Theionarchaea archaeon]|nr:winged helix-turn-helix transcriptional regulator [Theionarchaea archaeon]